MNINQNIFKAYDIRGVYPDQINEEVAYKIGQAYLRVIDPKGPIAVGMDVRIHSKALKEALVEGLLDGGADVIDLGLISTEMLYFAVGNYGLQGGIQVTASHNTAEYNGFKMTRAKAFPISSETGMFEMRDLIIEDKESIKKERGSLENKDVLDDFARFVVNFIDKEKIKPFRIGYNPSFGFEGVVLERVRDIGRFQFDLVGMDHIPDGSFPKGSPDPFRIENRSEFVEFIKKSNVDIGVAWDADADRVFFCTGSGKFIEPYYTNAILIKQILEKNGGGKIIYDPRYIWALVDAAKEAGGEAIMERVGHSFIKARMKEEDAIFSGESSGHTYFRDFWYADSGIIPLLMILEIISSGQSFEELLKPLFSKYFISGEINTKVDDKERVFKELKEKYSDGEFSEIDGLCIEFDSWRASIRASNTEPLMRVNVEGKTQEIVDQKKEEIMQILKEEDPQ
ncbi:MAG: phosphomannomutase/phosphoglucomutase [Candidatus Nealsonbacteria bacterium]|nr:phosphomannomutase/phosphoglucomutase [Candidatus Nealsonbacteria bacterium]